MSLLGAVCSSVSSASVLSASEKAIEILKENGLSADAESLRDYLDSLHPDSDTTQHVRKLIAQLGDDDFFVRESALQELIRTPLHSPACFKKPSTGRPGSGLAGQASIETRQRPHGAPALCGVFRHRDRRLQAWPRPLSMLFLIARMNT